MYLELYVNIFSSILANFFLQKIFNKSKTYSDEPISNKKRKYNNRVDDSNIVYLPYGLVVRIPAFHAGGPGSIPGVGILLFYVYIYKHKHLRESQES